MRPALGMTLTPLLSGLRQPSKKWMCIPAAIEIRRCPSGLTPSLIRERTFFTSWGFTARRMHPAFSGTSSPLATNFTPNSFASSLQRASLISLITKSSALARPALRIPLKRASPIFPAPIRLKPSLIIRFSWNFGMLNRRLKSCQRQTCLRHGLRLHFYPHPLGHLYLPGMVHRPGSAMGHHVNERAGRGETCPALLCPSEGEVYLGPYGRQVHVAKSVLAPLPNLPGLAVVFCNYRDYQPVVRIVMYRYGLLQVFYGDDSHVGTKYLFSQHHTLWVGFCPINKRRQEVPLIILRPF